MEFSVEQILSIGMTMIVIPWMAWVSVSLFNQRQEIALLRQILEQVSKRGTHHSS